MKHSIYILLILACCAEGAFGQSYPFRSYSIEKGLTQAVVHDMMQDEEGYLWIATGYGLNRFDGVRFRNYYKENGLRNNKVYSLHQDGEGTIWVGTASGVNIIEGDSLVTVPELEALHTTTVLSIFGESGGDYWFATDGQGVWHLDRSGKLTQYISIHGLANDRVRDIVEDEEGTLWFATREGLTSLNDGNFRSYTDKHGLPDNKIRDLLLDRQGRLWIATRGGLSLFSDGKFVTYTERDGLINNRVQSLSPDEDDGLWIGTEEGVSHFTGRGFENYTVEQGLSNNLIYSTLFDREQNIWFGTFGGGVSVFFGDHIQNFTVEEGLPNNVVTSITEDHHGNHWITTYGGGLSKYDGQSFENFTGANGLVDNKAYTAIVDHRNRILVGTRWGLSIYDGEAFRNFDETELPYRKVRAIIEPDDRRGYWIGTYGEGVLEMRDDSFRQYREKDGLANNTVLSVEQDGEGGVWFATYGGASRIKDGDFTNYTIQDGLPNNGVLDILRDRSGRMWFSTFGGIALLTEEGMEAITEEDGLPDEVCYFIIQDDEGIFWIGTKEGVVRFDYEQYRSAADSDSRGGAFKLITSDQGLIANEMNTSAAFKDSNGDLWFGSVGGLTRYIPSRAPVRNAPPKVHIENVMVSGEQVGGWKELKIGSDNRNVTIEYIGISLKAPEQVTYEYRLRESDEPWQKTSERSVRFSSLLPGEYTFQVRARNNAGQWSTETASLSFTVLAPFWLQWWFVGGVVLLLLGIMAFIYNYYRARKMIEMERMRVRIASDLHDDVGSALTEIALQSDFLQTTDAGEEIKNSLKQIGTQSRKIVSSLDDIVWSIDARNDTLGDLTDRMQDYINNMLPDKEVRYEFDQLDMEEKLTVQMKENLYLIFKEAVNNIARHSGAERVEVELKNRNGTFDLYIHDDGRGMEAGRKTGQGLQNMKMRAERIGADIDFDNKEGFTVHVYGKGM